MNLAKRVSVIGCPGAGKTTFSRTLAKYTGLPLIHLDLLYYDGSKSYTQDRESWRAAVTKLTQEDRWIIEGNYKSTFDIRLPAADTIIFLDYPRHIALWRMLKRRVQFHSKLRADMPEGWKEKISPAFFRFVWRYNKNERPRVYQLLDAQQGKVVIVLRSPKQAQRYLSEVSK